MKPAGINHSMTFSILISVMAFVFWEGFVHISGLPIYLLPAPSDAVLEFAGDPLYFTSALGITLAEAGMGLVLGFTAGFVLGSVVSAFPQVEDGVMTLAILVKSTPLVAIAPLLTIWLGFGWVPKVIITGLLTFFPILVNVIVGLQSGSRDLNDLMSVMKASKWQSFRMLKIYLSLPFLFAGLRVAAPLALVGAVVAEWTGASGGLGRVMWLSYANLNLPPMFTSILILSFSGMVIYSVIILLERRFIHWHHAQLS